MESRLTPYEAVSLIDCKSVLVFAPHPDDEALGCGGLLAACASNGIPIAAVIVTSGDYGDHGQEYAQVREQESQAAAKLLGIGSLIFWREPDRGVAFNERLLAAARQAIVDSGADLMLAPSISEIHPDHRATAWIVIEATRRLVLEGAVHRVALYEIGSPLPRVNVLVDITAQESTKRAAVACYRSQLAIQRYEEQIMALNRFRSYTLPSQTVFAEAYRLLASHELMQPVIVAEPELHRQERLNMVRPRSRAEKVSVLIRSMDRPSLGRALDSVALQTWPNIEVLVLNAKGREHRAMADQVGALPLRFIDSSDPLPRSEAANRLLEHADSELAIYLDDDDWFAPDHISHLVEHIRDKRDTVAAYSGVEFGQMVTDTDFQERWQVQHQFNAQFDDCRLLFENYLPIHSVLFRLKEVRDDWNCRFDTAMDVFEDWDFWLQLAHRGKFSGTGHVSAFYADNKADSSGVSVEPDENRPRMFRLREKWFSRIAPQRYLRLLDYTQTMYRELAAAKLQLTELARNQTVQQDRYLLVSEQLNSAALELEKALTQKRLALEQVSLEQAVMEKTLREQASLQARNLNAAAQVQADELLAIVSARDQEIANFHRHTQGLVGTLTERDKEIAHLRARLQTLEDAIASRSWLLLQLLGRKKSPTASVH